jgi:hypothetical protein
MGKGLYAYSGTSQDQSSAWALINTWGPKAGIHEAQVSWCAPCLESSKHNHVPGSAPVHQNCWFQTHFQLSNWAHDGHVWSIFLCSFYYVMILLLFWGHKPCIRFFLWRFNMPDALICYPGSIEKLKLLGATYLLTTYLLKLGAMTLQLPNGSLDQTLEPLRAKQ